MLSVGAVVAWIGKRFMALNVGWDRQPGADMVGANLKMTMMDAKYIPPCKVQILAHSIAIR